MFEAFATVCLLSSASICEQVLVPGMSADTESACIEQVSIGFDEWKSKLRQMYKVGSYECLLRPDSELKFNELGEGVFVHRGKVSDLNRESRGNISNIGFIVGRDSIALIDSGGSRWVGEQVYFAIREVSDLPVSHVILTHMHPDHVYGASVFADIGSKIVGHAKLDRSLADRAESYQTSYWRLLMPEDLIASRFVGTGLKVSDQYILDLGNRELQLDAWNLAHSNSDLTVYDRQSKLLFVGDLVFNQFIPVLDGALLGWKAVLKELKKIPARMVIPGHGGPVLPWPDGDNDQLRYFDVLTNDTRKMLDKGISLGEAAKVVGMSESENWSLFDEFNQRNAISIYTELEWE